MSVQGSDRYSRSLPCPICGGDPTRPPGKAERCFGYRSTDSNDRPWAFCTREEFAGDALFSDGANAYAHALEGSCKCGLMHGGFGYRERPYGSRSAPQVQPKDERPRLDADTLHAVNRAYLALLPMRREHDSYYASRGAADLAVARSHSYGSLPLGYKMARSVVDSLVTRFGIEIMQRVPGFYSGKDGRLLTHTARADEDAAVIPLLDEQGRIIGLIRHYIVGSKPKYMMFRGGTNDAYTIAGSWLTGAVRQVAIVEGPHKAHVAAQYSAGIVMLGVMGTNLRDAHLAAIERLRPDVVMEALDGDKFTNPNVEKARSKLHDKLLGSERLERAGVQIMTVVWATDDGKGLDDLLAAGHTPMLRSVPRRPAVTARKPHPTPAPGRVTPGRPLAEVQAETEAVIAHFIKNRRTKHGRVKLIQVPPGVGKTTAAMRAIVKYGAAARILVSTTKKAQEIAAANPSIRPVEGRNAENCVQFDVVEAAREKGHDVFNLICKKRCPWKRECVYFQQFRTLGPLVGAVEMQYSGAFLRRGELVVFDDPAIDRAMIDTRVIRTDSALRLAAAVPPGPTRDLMLVIQRAIDALKAATAFATPLIGADCWDALARAAGGADRLVALVRAMPDQDAILPSPGESGLFTAEDIMRAPDAVLPLLVAVMRSEVNAFADGREFNSALSIHPGGLELRTLRPLPEDKKTEVPMLWGRAVLILDATPILPLYEELTVGMDQEPIYAPEVTLPTNVTVTQVADRFYGKTAVERQTPDGRQPGRDALLASLGEQRRLHPGDREAVICSKALKEDVVSAGFDEDRVLNFYGSRGLNAIEDADVLHILGRPQAPAHTALQIAHVLHVNDTPVSSHMLMREEPYAGYRAAGGTGRAITVLDFADERVSELFRAYRESEMVQAIHRARLFRVGSPQMSMFVPDGQRIARTASERQHVRLVIHSAHPIPGLRVDELVYDEAPGVNERRAAEAAERILAACQKLASEGVTVTVNAVKRVTGSRKDIITGVLADSEFDPARSPPLVKTSSSRGGDRAGSNSSPGTRNCPPNGVPCPFAPSAEWQIVPDGFPCPPGGQYRMDFSTGENWGRWPEQEDAAAG